MSNKLDENECVVIGRGISPGWGAKSPFGSDCVVLLKEDPYGTHLQAMHVPFDDIEIVTELLLSTREKVLARRRGVIGKRAKDSPLEEGSILPAKRTLRKQ
jgi:hypothetical protein